MLIAQLSDVHIRPIGQLYKDVANSNRSVRRAIEHVHGLDRRPDIALLTGDLTDFGHPDEYLAVRELLAHLQIPYFVMPGNHDHRDNLRSAFADHSYLPPAGPLNYAIDDYEVRIIALDSCVPGKHHGDLSAETLTWLQKTLQNEPSKPTIIALHHPPFKSGIGYLDAYRYLNAHHLETIVRQFSNITAILCGHVHRTMMRRWAGTIVCACPSIATEIALQLAPQASPQSVLGPAAIMLHLWQRDEGLISHVSYIDEYPGPYPFF